MTQWPISYASLPGRRVTRRDRVHAEARQILAAMRAGELLHHGIATVMRAGDHQNLGDEPCWCLSGGTIVDAEVAALVIKNPEVTADADTLFAGALTQTFTIKRKEIEK